MEMFWTRASDMAGAPSVIGGFSEVVRKTRLVATFGSSPTQVLQLAHGPIRDVVQAGAVAEEARQDVEVDLVDQARSRSGVPDSNRRPPLYEEGRCVKSSVVVSPSQGGRGGGGWRAVLISLSPPRVGGHGRWEFAPVAQLLRDRQAARGSVAPLGAKGWLRVSMCQIASVSRRARSICATLAPRCLPMRAFMCW